MSESGFDLGFDDASQAGVYQVDAADVPALAAAARDAGLLVRRIDLAGCRDKQTLLLRIATMLDVPGGRGGNWDALMDALRDLEWLPAPGYMLLFEAAGQLQSARADELQTLLGLLQEASHWWAEAEVPFWAFVALESPVSARDS
ncbi:barstar family protein [Pseudoxanthomonas daejeonensis]|uniref:barstar family protein n=1 Tax=Pseudoxanthomonas daejeonensis TaxID=266062 RepID=UPI001F544D12|nr:barstar family protein [Pseudoxanthomonas daejeonensis]UNK57391.1 barstar family protein [Pseudoxanthomonas daejeonensis]